MEIFTEFWSHIDNRTVSVLQISEQPIFFATVNNPFLFFVIMDNSKTTWFGCFGCKFREGSSCEGRRQTLGSGCQETLHPGKKFYANGK